MSLPDTLAAGLAGPAAPVAGQPRRLPRWPAGRLTAFAVGALSLLASLLLWHALATSRAHLGFITFAHVPPPSEVLEAGIELLSSPKLSLHVGHSLARIGAGYLSAALAGVGLGLLIGRFRWAARALLPPLEVLRPIPAVAWIPLAILMFPSTEVSMMFITFTGAIFPILLNTIHGVEAVDPRLVASARSLGTRGPRLFAEVILPSAAPGIFTGLSIGMGTCWFCLVSAEMISGQFGIGYYTWESYTLQNYAGIVVGMLFIGAFGMASSALVRWLGHFATPWYRLQEKKA
ncbi:ABC transporter permease [Methyloversatilis discipulorum]|uniref:ABC transporter permease n=1 Tax=Methyloversatilis discipulorum TaxID=1119528 RepID=UPI0026EA6EAD|nr:ABC transporter permease [Methyloversatilis discipulorum]